MIDIKKISREEVKILNKIRNLCVDYLHNSKKFTLEESYDWFDKTSPNFFSIYYNQEMIGYFRISNFSIENKNLYIGADLHPQYWNRGLGFESYKKMIPFLFNEYNLNKISLEVLVTNHRAISLYKKLGFKEEGIKREEIFKDGQYVDSIIMSILKKETNYDY